MASSWQASHFVVVIAAAGLAFGLGYTIGGNRSRPAAVQTGDNMSAPVLPGYEVNQAEAQPPAPTRRSRPDENELIAANAETEDGQRRPAGADRPDRDSTRSGREREERPRADRDSRDEEEMPPEDPYDRGPYGPDDE